jgi:vacuolar-type H+-ATPase subunit E/Vma4
MKKNIFNRISGLVEEGVERAQEVAGDVQHRMREEASVLARRARSGIREGRERAIHAEEQMVDTVKAHPTVFVLAAVGLGFLTAAMIYAATERKRD